MPTMDRSHALDHIVVVLFENRSLDNVLGHLYGPGDGKSFEGVIGKDLSNPIPAWAEHGADRKVVPYTVATDMDSPNPGKGMGPGLIARARAMDVKVPPELDDPHAALSPGRIVPFLRDIAGHFFPLLGQQDSWTAAALCQAEDGGGTWPG